MNNHSIYLKDVWKKTLEKIIETKKSEIDDDDE